MRTADRGHLIIFFILLLMIKRGQDETKSKQLQSESRQFAKNPHQAMHESTREKARNGEKYKRESKTHVTTSKKSNFSQKICRFMKQKKKPTSKKQRRTTKNDKFKRKEIDPETEIKGKFNG